MDYDKLYRIKQINLLKKTFENKIIDLDLEKEIIVNELGLNESDLNSELDNISCGIEYSINNKDESIKSNFIPNRNTSKSVCNTVSIKSIKK